MKQQPRRTEREMLAAGWVKHHSSLYIHPKDNRELYLDTRYGRWAMREGGRAHLLAVHSLGEAFAVALQPAQRGLLP